MSGRIFDLKVSMVDVLSIKTKWAKYYLSHQKHVCEFIIKKVTLGRANVMN
jgi:hypothetical protein